MKHYGKRQIQRQRKLERQRQGKTCPAGSPEHHPKLHQPVESTVNDATANRWGTVGRDGTCVAKKHRTPPVEASAISEIVRRV